MPIYATEPLEKPSNWRCWWSRKGGERRGRELALGVMHRPPPLFAETRPHRGATDTNRSWGGEMHITLKEPPLSIQTPLPPEWPEHQLHLKSHPSLGEGWASLWGSWQTQQGQLQVLPTGSATWRPTPSSQTFPTKNPEVSNNILAVHMWTEGSDRYLKKTANIKATKMEKRNLEKQTDIGTKEYLRGQREYCISDTRDIILKCLRTKKSQKFKIYYKNFNTSTWQEKQTIKFQNTWD